MLLIVSSVQEGEPECDWKAGEWEDWEDWDSDAGDPRDDERNKDLYLAGFKYTYCDKEGGQSGCTLGHHQAWDPTQPIYRKISDMEAAVLRKMKRKREHSDYQAPESNRFVRYRR